MASAVPKTAAKATMKEVACDMTNRMSKMRRDTRCEKDRMVSPNSQLKKERDWSGSGKPKTGSRRAVIRTRMQQLSSMLGHAGSSACVTLLLWLARRRDENWGWE